MRYLRLLLLFLKSSLLIELEYRANLLARTVVSLIDIGVVLVGTGVFYSHTETIGGWTFNEALVIVGVFTFMGGFISALLRPNVQNIIEMIRTGTLDFVLTKPVNSQFVASLRYSSLYNTVDMATGVAITLIAFSRMGYAPEAPALAQFAFVMLMALLIVYSIWITIATLAFWLVKVGNLAELFGSIYDTGRFPIHTYQGMIRVMLTFVIPIAFITTFPAQAVLGRLEPLTLITAAVMGVLMFAFSAWFWHFAVRRYSSASS
jgi:ABC-2 type transport system permease protein